MQGFELEKPNRKMKKIVGLLFLFLFLFLSSCIINNKDNHSGETNHDNKKTSGKLICLEKSAIFGVIPADTIIEGLFQFVNIGAETVKIIYYDVSCGCTLAILSDSLVMPGDSTIFIMSVNTQGKSPGNHVVNAVLKTNGLQTFYKLDVKFTIPDED